MLKQIPLQVHTSCVKSVFYSTALSKVVTMATDGTICTIDPDNLHYESLNQVDGLALGCATPSGAIIATVKGQILLIDLINNRAEVLPFKCQGRPSAICMSKQHAYVGDWEGNIYQINCESKQAKQFILSQFKIEERSVPNGVYALEIAYKNDGSEVVLAGLSSGHLLFGEFAKFQITKLHQKAIRSVKVYKSQVITTGNDGAVRICEELIEGKCAVPSNLDEVAKNISNDFASASKFLQDANKKQPENISNIEGRSANCIEEISNQIQCRSTNIIEYDPTAIISREVQTRYMDNEYIFTSEVVENKLVFGGTGFQAEVVDLQTYKTKSHIPTNSECWSLCYHEGKLFMGFESGLINVVYMNEKSINQFEPLIYQAQKFSNSSDNRLDFGGILKFKNISEYKQKVKINWVEGKKKYPCFHVAFVGKVLCLVHNRYQKCKISFQQQQNLGIELENQLDAEYSVSSVIIGTIEHDEYIPGAKPKVEMDPETKQMYDICLCFQVDVDMDKVYQIYCDVGENPNQVAERFLKQSGIQAKDEEKEDYLKRIAEFVKANTPQVKIHESFTTHKALQRMRAKSVNLEKYFSNPQELDQERRKKHEKAKKIEWRGVQNFIRWELYDRNRVHAREEEGSEYSGEEQRGEEEDDKFF